MALVTACNSGLAKPWREPRRCNQCVEYQVRRSCLSSALIDFGPFSDELDCFFLHSLLQRFVGRESLLLRILAHVLRDLHRAEVRTAHRTEVGGLHRILRQRLVVKILGGVGIEAEVELVLPAELEASLG